jgi:hypothetical protein
MHLAMTWQRRRNSCVLCFGDGLHAYPRIEVFPVTDDPRSPWAATVHDRLERSYWPSQSYASVLEAQRGALEYARLVLSREWHPAVGAAIAALEAGERKSA